MTDFLAQTLSVLSGNVIPALIVLTAVVFVHEMGHFLVARWCGIRVAAFSIGFGRELAGFTDRRGTRWKLSAIPLGGYVRFEGDDNAASIPDAETLARVPPSERVGLFHFAPLWQRIAVVAAGPLANFLLAIVVFAAVFTLVGRQHVLPVVGSVEAGSPAEQAGFQADDRIVSVNGDAIDAFSDLQDIVMLAAGERLEVVVDRGGRVGDVHRGPGAARGGRHRRPHAQHRRPRHKVGARPTSAPTIRSRRCRRARKRRFASSSARSPISASCSRVAQNAEQLSGLIGIGQVSGAVASEGGLPGLVYLTAVLSVSIGLFNLFPVPMLDGGHLLFYLIEALRGRPLSPRLQDIGFRIGFALVIFLFIFVTFNDIANLAGS